VYHFFGLDPHHHGDGIVHFCGDSGDEEERTPCSGDCLIDMPDADDFPLSAGVFPSALEVTRLPGFYFLGQGILPEKRDSVSNPDTGPPGLRGLTPSPQSYCRFLI
jgi:hypothetical protein